MAGRGRGRGRGVSLNINLESLGLGRGDVLTPVLAQPPPLYPLMLYKPVPLTSNSELDYMLALKQELKDSFQTSPFYVNLPTKVKDIERYSDKYQTALHSSEKKLNPDWHRLPFELQEKRVRKKVVGKLKPNVKSAIQNKDIESLLHRLEHEDAPDAQQTEGAEAQDDEEDGIKKIKEEQGENEEEEEYDDEDLEEETDYNQAYFDNGEDYGDEDDDEDEGPTY